MRVLLKNAAVVNVFTGELERENILLEEEHIIGVGAYGDEDADRTEDFSGKYLCPGFIDGHIHIESSMLLPAEFARAAVPHGTTAIVADPHEIANVCGTDGIDFMLEASEGLPLDAYMMIPSCVPATVFDEAGAGLDAADIVSFYSHPRVLGLGEVMNYVGVVNGNTEVLQKVSDAKKLGLCINGHAPLLSGSELDCYIAAGIRDDHECSNAEEAMERIRKGQRVLIRQGTAARNLQMLLPLFEEPWAQRCLLVTDDKHPADLIENGHLDDIIRQAAKAGKNPITGIQMATIRAAEYFGLQDQGAIAPGYFADIVVLDNLEEMAVNSVFYKGKKVVSDGKMLPFEMPEIRPALLQKVRNTFCMDALKKEQFLIRADGRRKCRVIRLIKDQLLTEEWQTEIDFSENNGVDFERDILKIAVLERHRNTGHIGLGFICGTGLKEGAIASSVSHDSHNLIVIGTGESDMAAAANRVREMGGGMAVIRNGKVLAEMPLPFGGLMTDETAQTAAAQNEAVRKNVYELGASEDAEPFMTMAFVSLPVIPHLKMTTTGLVDVDRQENISLFV